MFFKIEIGNFLLARAWCILAPKYRRGNPKITAPRGGRSPNPDITKKLRTRAIFLWV
jgi:hypothetical protein